MSRISIDVSAEDHKRLKAMAALRGVSLKDYLLDGKLEAINGNDSMAELEALLDERIEHHRKSGLRGRSSAKAILDEVISSRS